MEAALALVVLLGGALVFGAILFFTSAARRVRLETIIAAVRELDPDAAGSVRLRRFGMNAVVRGVPVRWDMLGAGERGTMHTICSVSLTQAPPFLLELRKQTGEELEQVRTGRAVDVIVDDPAFDDAFIVEAAPAEAARRLLDADVRRMLLAMQPLRLCIAKDTLWLDVIGVVGHVAIAKSMLELVLSMARRIGEMPRALAEKRMTAEARGAEDAAYRGPTPQSTNAMEVWSPAAEKEISALLLARKQRERRRWIALGLGVAAWLAFSLATITMMRCATR